MVDSDCVAGVGVENREREIAEGGGESKQKLGLGTEKETRSTYSRTLPRPHVRKDLQYRRKNGTFGGARELIERISLHNHCTAPPI